MFYGFLCVLSSQVIPVVGLLLFIGYIFDVAESLHRHPDRTYPDFTFNKFSNYLQRGVWPFLVSLVFSIPILAVLAVICVVEGFGVAAAASAVGREIVPWVIVGGVVLILATFFLLLNLAFIPVTPLFIRAGLSQDGRELFSVRWAMDFLKRVWLEVLLLYLFLVATGIHLMLLGLACCGIGEFVATSVVWLANASVFAQLYDLYLARGGEPIPFKEPAK